jgi:hypothetical protein
MLVSFQAVAFDLVDGHLVEGPRVDCENPALAIQTAQGQWKIFGHAGAVAFSRTSSFDRENSGRTLVLRRFGQVPEQYLANGGLASGEASSPGGG